MDNIIARLHDAAHNDPDSGWHDVVTTEHIAYVESVIDIELPKLLKRCYTEISNGGFGPAYGITGLPGGHESSWGDLIQTVAELRKLDECEDGWLPLIDWGCAQFLCVDCDNDDLIVTLYEGDFHQEGYSFQTVLERWVQGEIPDLDTGEFRHLA